MGTASASSLSTGTTSSHVGHDALTTATSPSGRSTSVARHPVDDEAVHLVRLLDVEEVPGAVDRVETRPVVQRLGGATDDVDAEAAVDLAVQVQRRLRGRL